MESSEEVIETQEGLREVDPETGELLNINTEERAPSLVVGNDAYSNALNQLQDIDEAEEGFCLSTEFMKFTKQGQKVRGIFLGIEASPVKKFDMAKLLTKERAYVLSGVNLIDQLNKIPEGTPVQIEFKGASKNQSSDGSTNVFDVKILKVK